MEGNTNPNSISMTDLLSRKLPEFPSHRFTALAIAIKRVNGDGEKPIHFNPEYCGYEPLYEPTPDYDCERHELVNSPYPSGECPYCEEEFHRESMIRHEMTRDPTVEPW